MQLDEGFAQLDQDCSDEEDGSEEDGSEEDDPVEREELVHVRNAASLLISIIGLILEAENGDTGLVPAGYSGETWGLDDDRVAPMHHMLLYEQLKMKFLRDSQDLRYSYFRPLVGSSSLQKFAACIGLLSSIWHIFSARDLSLFKEIVSARLNLLMTDEVCRFDVWARSWVDIMEIRVKCDLVYSLYSRMAGKFSQFILFYRNVKMKADLRHFIGFLRQADKFGLGHAAFDIFNFELLAFSIYSRLWIKELGLNGCLVH
jgi:hypothetical protein